MKLMIIYLCLPVYYWSQRPVWKISEVDFLSFLVWLLPLPTPPGSGFRRHLSTCDHGSCPLRTTPQHLPPCFLHPHRPQNFCRQIRRKIEISRCHTWPPNPWRWHLDQTVGSKGLQVWPKLRPW